MEDVYSERLNNYRREDYFKPENKYKKKKITKQIKEESIKIKFIPELNIEVRVLANNCWIYGDDSTIYKNIKGKLAHRLSYEIFKGPVPINRLICHNCDRPACINPEHLFKGTISDNNQDCKNKRRNKRFGFIDTRKYLPKTISRNFK